MMDVSLADVPMQITDEPQVLSGIGVSPNQHAEPVPAVSSSASPAVPAPHSVSQNSPISHPLKQHRLFLDICCGHRGPLSSSVMSLGGDVVQFDILIHSGDDLLDDATFSRLMKLASSGIIAYCACSPSCCEYSRLKLKPGGPPALRTPEFLDGVPGISGDDLLKVQESNLMLERCIHLLQLVIASGGHGHLEQPSSAMSWEEPLVRSFIRTYACACVYVAACGYGKDWHKSWMFASTLQDLQSIAYQCPHSPGSHQSIVGVRSASGQFLIRDTAEYPEALCECIAQVVFPLVSTHGQNLTLESALLLVPVKDYLDQPFSRPDGAGDASQGDWSSPHTCHDVFVALRKQFFQKIVDIRLDKQLVSAFSQHSDQPPFSEEQLLPFRRLLDEFLEAQGVSPDWSVPTGQQI